MQYFTYWLEHFKEIPPAKAQTIVKTTSSLSEKTASICAATGKLAECQTLVSFNRTKQAILRAQNIDLTQAEKRALSLFGDYLEFRKYSNFKFPEISSDLLNQYCKTMQMSYSYKAVLIHELVRSNRSGITTDELVKLMIAYYQDRLDHGTIAEKEDSIFSKAFVSFAAAKKVIMSNPVPVLVEANIITWNKRTGVISLTSDYSPATTAARDDVCVACKERLKRYYSSIKPQKECTTKDTLKDNKKLVRLLKRLEAEIHNTPDKTSKKKLLTIYTSICNELGISAKVKSQKKVKKQKNPAVSLPTEYYTIPQNDERKVGILVQNSMALLEKIGYPFSTIQLNRMASSEWSNSTLKLNYPFIKLVDESKTIADQRIDHLGYSRYYSRVFSFSGKKYLVSSQWYAKSKPLFIDWFNSLKNKVPKN